MVAGAGALESVLYVAELRVRVAEQQGAQQCVVQCTLRGKPRREEAAGVGAAIVGSFYMMLVVLVLAVPIGVAASIYLEEFAPKNRWTDLIEVNIANLAAVPSIVFGILGLAAFINFAGLPQSAPIA